MLCSYFYSRKGQEQKRDPGDVFPDKFQKLEKFFDDLKSNFGKVNMFEMLGVEEAMDIFILSTRTGSR